MEMLSSNVKTSDAKIDELSSLGKESLKTEILEKLDNKSQEIIKDLQNEFKAATKSIGDKANNFKALNKRSDDVTTSILELKNENKSLSKLSTWQFFYFYVYQSRIYI